jgi:hypothetical protein
VSVFSFQKHLLELNLCIPLSANFTDSWLRVPLAAAVDAWPPAGPREAHNSRVRGTTLKSEYLNFATKLTSLY